MRRLPTLDLFSGVGGFSLGLQDVCRTVGYCDWEPSCREVLRANMRRGKLEQAPIFKDVKELRYKQLPVPPVMITAGFPCQDISTNNRTRTGVTGERSSMVFEVIRLVDEGGSKVKVVLLENVAAIIESGMELVLKELWKRGFTCAWTVATAGEAGAPHLRRRWWCLAVRDGFPAPRLTTRVQGRVWPAEPERFVPRPAAAPRLRAMIRRLGMLGNSVVPPCVRLAYASLAEAHAGALPATRARNLNRLSVVLSVPGHPKSGSKVETTHLLRPSGPGDPLPAKARPMAHIRAQGVDVTKARFATPRKSMWGQFRHIKAEAQFTNVLSNQLYYDVESQRLLKRKYPGVEVSHMDQVASIDPRFVEWMMGYPAGWTAIDPVHTPTELARLGIERASGPRTGLEQKQKKQK